LRRTLLATADAHTLYRSYGFDDLPNPGRFLAIQQPATTLYAEPATPNGESVTANGEAVPATPNGDAAASGEVLGDGRV
jgi:hypothetical protein